MNIAALKRAKADAVAKMQAIVTLAESEHRDLSETELAAYNGHKAEIASLDARIARAEEVEAAAKAASIATAQPIIPGGVQTHDNAEDAPWAPDGNAGAAFGAQMRAVFHANEKAGSGQIDPRLRPLMASAPSGSNEGVGSEGMFALNGPARLYVDKMMFESAQLLPRCLPIRLGAGQNSTEIDVIDETSRVAGSRFGSVRVYHAAEANTVTATKPKVRKVDTKLEKIMGLWYLSGEQMADSDLLASIGPQAFAEEIAFQVDEDIFRGSGVGMALGFMSAGCLVTVAKETGQAADTIVPENINKMWSRMPSRSKLNSIWLVNPDCTPALEGMFYEMGTGGYPVYLPPGGLSDAPLGRLKGRPVIENEHSATLGDLGDIALVDLGWYAALRKSDSIQADSSIHVRFIYDEFAFRFMYRFNGLPVLSSAITPAQGSNTVSPFVTLAARA